VSNSRRWVIELRTCQGFIREIKTVPARDQDFSIAEQGSGVKGSHLVQAVSGRPSLANWIVKFGSANRGENWIVSADDEHRASR
jgi:hypothetical protein